jgi:uncharacterized protein (DUF1015 family)
MATIRAFQAIHYNPACVPDLSSVVSQPHDQVTPELQDRYYQLSPYNVVRILRGKEMPGDKQANNAYTRARDTLQAWLAQGILVQERAPVLYILRQTFPFLDGSTKSRLAIIAALALSPFDEGIVLPHERTLPKSMTDRLELLRATSADLGCIFVLYPGGELDALATQIIERKPGVALRELVECEVLQQVWQVSDPAVVAAFVEAMASKRGLVIADGHHRYETGLKHRDEMRVAHPAAPPSAGFNYCLAALVSMEDPGLVILPTHRIIHARNGLDGAGVLEKAMEYFEVAPVDGRAALEAALHAPRAVGPRFGFHDGTCAVLTLRDPAIMERLLPERSPSWRTLDTAVLHELFIERVLGISKEEVAQGERVEFVRDTQAGYEAVAQGKAECFLLLNPTRIEQVRACSAAGERMPQKATFFYPKIISGLAILPAGTE